MFHSGISQLCEGQAVLQEDEEALSRTAALAPLWLFLAAAKTVFSGPAAGQEGTKLQSPSGARAEWTIAACLATMCLN